MHIIVLGLRGFPGIQGGVETHAEQLYTRIAATTTHEIEILTRSSYWPAENSYQPPSNLRFSRLWSPATTGVETLVHSFIGTIYAVLKRPDVLHVHAVGPALFTPLARLFGIKVIFTHHGPDYDREKWGGAAKALLRLGERMGARFANTRIVISEVIQQIIQRKHNKPSELVFNGVDSPGEIGDSNVLENLDLQTHKYILMVSRVVPEKRQLDLVAAFNKSQLDGWKLVLVGCVDGEDSYSEQVREAAEDNSNIVLSGFQNGDALATLFDKAGLFVLPSTHEGLPIALLEALSFGLPVIASNIPANLELELPPESYFQATDVDHLAERISELSAIPYDAESRQKTSAWVCEKYNWDHIATQTVATYEALYNKSGKTIGDETKDAAEAPN